MSQNGLDSLRAEVAALSPIHHAGQLSEIGQTTAMASGLAAHVALGDLVEIRSGRCEPVTAEVIAIRAGQVVLMPDGNLGGFQLGDLVVLTSKNRIAPSAAWIGRVIDPYGRPMDGRPIMNGPEARALHGEAMNPTQRRGLGARMNTGLAVFNTLLPIVRGQRIGLFAGSGVGKSTLLGRLALGMEVDVVVVAMIGERSREVREFIDRILGPEGMRRAVVVAATSDQSPVLRRRCAWTAAAVAEHFRDQGMHVLLLADSVTRFAEAHRDAALAAGEMASARGFPPSTAHQIAALCERAGPGSDYAGDITAVFTVLVAGSDMEEPVADMLRGVLDGHVVLDRRIAERGRFPAIDLLRSVSRSLPEAADEAENALIGQARATLGLFERNEIMIQAGLYERGSDAALDRAIALWPGLDAFVGAPEHADVASSFDRLRAILGAGTGEAD